MEFDRGGVEDEVGSLENAHHILLVVQNFSIGVLGIKNGDHEVRFLGLIDFLMFDEFAEVFMQVLFDI